MGAGKQMKKHLISILVLFLLLSTSFVGVSNQRERGIVDTRTSDFSVDNGPNSNLFLVNETPGIQWIRHFGAPDNSDDAKKVRLTSDGGYILVGETQSYTADHEFDAWLIKTDKNGNEEWNRTYGEVGFLNWTEGFSVEQTQDGGYIFVGYRDIYKDQENTHAWVVKTTADGTEQWNKMYNNSFRGECIQQTTDGGYIITGDSLLMDTWVCRIDENGDIVWEQTFYKADSSMGTCVKQTPDGGFIVVGRLDYPENETGFLIKTDADGHEQWNKTYGGFAPFSGFYSVQPLPDGYIVAGCVCLDGLYGQAWLVRTNEAGNVSWNRIFSFDPDSGAGASEVDCTSDGGFILAGDFVTTRSSGWILKTDAEGNQEWQITSVEWYDQAFYSVQETSNGSFIVAGISGEDGRGNAVLLKIGHVPNVTITKPVKALYFLDKERRAFRFPFIIGPITIEADAYDTEYSIERVEFLVDGVLKNTDTTAPYSWRWITPSFFIHTLTVTAYNAVWNCSSETINVLKIF